MVADILMDAGYRVFGACEAADALAILDGRDDIGAVFTDIEMPGGLTRLALAAAVRDRWPSMPVLVTSGRVRPGACELPIGAADLAKPYMPGEFVPTLGTHLPPHVPVCYCSIRLNHQRIMATPPESRSD